MKAMTSQPVSNSLNINTGAVRLQVNRDGHDNAGAIEFNPEDVTFVKNFKELVHSHKVKVREIEKEVNKISKIQGKDADGFDRQLDPSIDLQLDVCRWERTEIDRVFGAGTSDMVFGEYNNLRCFEQFYNAVAPHIQNVRTTKVDKYVGRKK